MREILAELAKKTVNVFSLISSKKSLALMKSEAQTNTAGLIAIKCNLQSSSKSCVTVPGTALAVMVVQAQKHLHTLLCCQL